MSSRPAVSGPPPGSPLHNGGVTLVLSATDLSAVLTTEGCLDALREGFLAAGDAVGERFRVDLPFDGTATALLPGTLPGIPAFSIKTNVKFPGARPALRGVISIHSGVDGELLALMDSATITAWRTGLSAALATDALARTDAATLGVVGAGAQAALTVRALRALRGDLDLIAHDIDPERAERFVDEHGGRIAASPQEVAAQADIVVTATWTREPLPIAVPARGGRHITSLGSDEPGKRELPPELLRQSALFVDDRAQSQAMGVLSYVDRHADAVIGEVLAGRHPGRASPTQNTVYAPVGLPWQDLALGWLALHTARDRGLGVAVDLLG